MVALVPFDDDSDCDPELLARAVDIVRSEKQRSTSLLQRRLRLGYTVASRLLDEIIEHDLDRRDPE